MASQLPRKGGVSPVKRKGLTLIPTIVRRPQHLPSGRQLWSPASLPPGIYCSAVCPAVQTHYSLSCPSPDTIHSPAQQNHTLNSIHSYNSRIYIISRNTLINLNTISNRLYLTLKARLLPSRMNAQLRDSTCHRKRPPPVRRQSPTPTTCGR